MVKTLKSQRLNKNNVFLVAVCDNKKSKFTKEKEASRLLNQLGNRTPLRKIPLLGNILF